VTASTTRAVLRQALRQHLPTFIHRSFQLVSPGMPYRHNWHIDAIAWQLRQCFERRIRRLIITMPPRNLKSICASVGCPAWALGLDPTLRFVTVSYSQELSAKHARDSRAVMQSAWYRETFPHTRLDPSKNSELEFETTARGGRLSTSIGGTLTGRGGDIIVIDDPMKPAEAMSDTKRAAVQEWYDGTLYSRLDDRTRGVIILVMQRLHLEDLVGHVLGKEEWAHLDLPAIALAPQRIRIADDEEHERAIGAVLHAEREPLAELERLRATLGSHAFQAQYQQQPVPTDGALIKWRWFRSYAQPLARRAGDQIIQSWDTANEAGERNDYSVCTTWLIRGEADHLLDLHRERLEFPDLKRQVVALRQRHEADAVLIEDRGSGTQLIQVLLEEGLHAIAIAPETDKATRLYAQSMHIEAGRVLLPAEAPWLAEFQTELLRFPQSQHDDQVDSLSQFLAWATSHSWGGPRIRTL
jgi:predicted phage terminase large subunit-like protein